MRFSHSCTSPQISSALSSPARPRCTQLRTRPEHRQRHVCRAGKEPRSSVQLAQALAVVFGLSAASLFTGLAHAEQLDHLHTSRPPRVLYSLAENEDFWNNLVQYARFFVSVLVGTAYVAFKPLAGLLKRPGSAIGVLVGAAAFGYFIKATVTAMLGSADPIDPFLP